MKSSFHVLLLVVLAALLSAFVAVKMVQPTPGAQPGLTTTDSAFDRVMKTGTIRCGFTYYSVALFKDKDGELKGIYKDLMDNIGQLLSLKVEWAEEVGWGEQIEGLKTGRYDMACSPANMTGPRAKGADFVTPIYYAPVFAWAREGDERFGADTKANLKRGDSSDIKIATIDGEQSEAQAKQFFPSAGLLSAPQSAPFSTLFNNVSQRKADLVIAEPVAVLEFMDKNPGQKLVPIDADDPLILAVNIMQVKSGDVRFKAMISNAITILIANGVVDKIIDKWEPYPKSYVRAPKVK